MRLPFQIDSMYDPRSFSQYAFDPLGTAPSDSRPMKKRGWNTLLLRPPLGVDTSGLWTEEFRQCGPCVQSLWLNWGVWEIWTVRWLQHTLWLMDTVYRYIILSYLISYILSSYLILYHIILYYIILSHIILHHIIYLISYLILYHIILSHLIDPIVHE